MCLPALAMAPVAHPPAPAPLFLGRVPLEDDVST
jgi:hypothetical protein